MKKSLVVYILLLVLILSSCGGASNPNKGDVMALKSEDFVFVTGKGKIELNASFKPADFGEYVYYESQSCGYSGMDKFYTYENFEVCTYPDGSVDRVSYIDLLDDAVTSRGIKLGDSKDLLIEKYGDSYTLTSGIYIYKLEECELLFTTEDSIITEIEYSYAGK